MKNAATIALFSLSPTTETLQTVRSFFIEKGKNIKIIKSKENRRAKRRHQSIMKLLQRKRMMQNHGQQSGLIYEKHRRKINRSLGYMRDGNVAHFVSVGFSKKTRDRDRYGPAVVRSPHDKRAALSAKQQLIEYWQKKEI